MSDPDGKPAGPANGSGGAADGLHYLWHLVALGLIDECTGQPAEPWSDLLDGTGALGRPARVAIIDNGCAGACGLPDQSDAINPFEHPNLSRDRLKHPIDFSAYPQGIQCAGLAETWAVERPAAPIDWLWGGKAEDALAPDAKFDTLLSGVRPQLAALIRDLVLGKAVCPKYYRFLPDPSDRFAAHGTACAGLVGASADIDKPSKNGVKGAGNPNAIRYAGVAPEVEIIPISTVYNDQFWPMISALLWAVVKGADVILIPRGLGDMAVADPAASCPEPPSEESVARQLRGTRLMSDKTRLDEKRLFEHLLARISTEIPVVMAAGNDGGNALPYPASLAAGDTPIAPHLIVVGAVTAGGQRSSYSSGAASGRRIIYAPSDDSEEISRDHLRFDSVSWRARHFAVTDAIEGAEDLGNDYAPHGVLAIDIPGSYGYNADPGPAHDYAEMGARNVDLFDEDSGPQKKLKTENMPRSLYSSFGGTSAAASLVAGCLALLRQQTAGPLTGEATLALLEKSMQPARNFAKAAPETGPAEVLSAAKLLSAVDPEQG